MSPPIQFPDRKKLQAYLNSHQMSLVECPQKKKIIEAVSIVFSNSKKDVNFIYPHVISCMYDFKDDLTKEKAAMIANLLGQDLLSYDQFSKAKL